MLFEKTKIEGLWVVNTVPVRDSRGSFARTFCKREFESNALVSDFSQHSLSLSKLKHTVQGCISSDRRIRRQSWFPASKDRSGMSPSICAGARPPICNGLARCCRPTMARSSTFPRVLHTASSRSATTLLCPI